MPVDPAGFPWFRERSFIRDLWRGANQKMNVCDNFVPGVRLHVRALSACSEIGCDMGIKRPDVYDMEVGRRIRAQRLTQGMSQETLAAKLNVTFQQVQKYEKGTNRVSAGRLRRIAEVLGVPISFFFADGDKGDRGADATSGFEFLGSARAVRLMKAFTRLTDPKLQAALVDLCEMVADSEAAPKSGSKKRRRATAS
jgi:transcriptional regulator with XRE-family HTH domain